MPLLAVPNVSEGRRDDVLDALTDTVVLSGGRVLDRHADPAHNRSVFTICGDLARAAAALAASAPAHIDLTRHEGAHPRLGVLDVWPVVPHRAPIEVAIEEAWMAGERIAEAELPVFFYGAAARRAETRELPELRRGGLDALVRRVAHGLAPDLGPRRIDPRRGVTCVGARGPLVAFNVWLRGDVGAARRIAAAARTSGGGPPGVRALGLAIAPPDVVQVSMNLTDPERTGIDEAFGVVERLARREGVVVTATEIVGLIEERFLPTPDRDAARLLMAPGRSVESVLLG